MKTNYKLIVIEGVDCSGKETQVNKLYNALKTDNVNVEKIEFPNYESNTSSLVKMYLGGEFGKNAEEVNPYMASAFFAVDRVGSIKSVWKQRLDNADVVIADRYVTSNMVHQASKLDDKNSKNELLEWIYDFEYNKLDLPKPDLVIFLDMPVECAQVLMKNRPNKIDNSKTLDIHESDVEYLKKSYDNAKFVAEKYNWHTVKCANDGTVRTIDDIANEVLNIVKQNINAN